MRSATAAVAAVARKFLVTLFRSGIKLRGSDRCMCMSMCMYDVRAGTTRLSLCNCRVVGYAIPYHGDRRTKRQAFDKL
jgi:hypothetical protein